MPHAHASGFPSLCPGAAGDRPPRYGLLTAVFFVGRGPVPRHSKVNFNDAKTRLLRDSGC